MSNEDHQHIYHLVQKPLWEATRGSEYLPPTYAHDGFIHATAEADQLLSVANHFYKDVQDAFICLQIDTAKLTSEVKYEPAAPVGDKVAHASTRLFPHIFGPINADAVSAELPVVRAEDGTFLEIQGVLPPQSQSSHATTITSQQNE
eukprot:TRINITY_DN1586_c0_g1_i1.p1 TRINITY_DN1586_c0_g1~~TRINITY_DN1586_c0_g1_i1.p1  ORF type:complete len:147 (-),score=28.93 TRINITY_DN1586_c0_g1_i1:51-491(-)